jgi:hypothetical protein
MMRPEEIEHVLGNVRTACLELCNRHGFTVMAGNKGFVVAPDGKNFIDGEVLRKLRNAAKRKKDQFVLYWLPADEAEFRKPDKFLYIHCNSAYEYYNETDEARAIEKVGAIFSRYGVVYEWRKVDPFKWKIKVTGCH